jgi:alpha-L-fucosidase
MPGRKFALETLKRMLAESRGGAGLILPLLLPLSLRAAEAGTDRKWWQRPGLGIMYQIEYRPGWEWERDYIEFNKSMMDEQGRLKFNGPFCRIEDWVELSKSTGMDYHIFEIKWHDGICYFNTQLTDWKTETDYAAQFAELSREAGIPFMYYYSSIFDHNPQFDSIQPSRKNTASFINHKRQPIYEDYLRGHYQEIVEQYRPDGMWIDWYWPDYSTKTTIKFFRENYPEMALAFNASNYNPTAGKKIDYTSGEAHTLSGPLVRMVKTETATLPVFQSAWKWANLNRRIMDHPWELVTPAGKWWQDPSLRDDPNDLVRMAAIIMASGGKLGIGVTAQLDGTVFPDQVKQLEILGQWYKPRKGLFIDGVAQRYFGMKPPGAKVDGDGFNLIACRHGDHTLIHVINMEGREGPITLELEGDASRGISRVSVEPGGGEAEVARSGSRLKVLLKPDEVDRVDTILRLVRR